MKSSFIILIAICLLASCRKNDPGSSGSNPIPGASYAPIPVFPNPLSPGHIPNSPTGKAILIDASKDGGVWWFPQSGTFSQDGQHQGKNLAAHLRGLGYQVDELARGTIITDQLLNNYVNVIRAGGFGNYSAAELTAYQNFLNRPTSLLLLQDHLANFPNDQLSIQLGTSFTGVQGGTITVFTSHEVTTGVSSFPFMVGSYIQNPDPSKITVLGSLLLSSGATACAMGVLHHPSARIFFIGDMNGLEQIPQPFTTNLVKWLFR